MPILNHRSNEVEIMDNLLCQGEVVDQTLRELETINRLLGGNSVTLEGIQKLLTYQTPAHLSIADLGCGGGDILKLVSNWGMKNKIRLTLSGIDANPNIVAFAKRNSEGYPTIKYRALNIFSKEFEETDFDIVTATLFTHHFSDNELISLLTLLRKRTKIGVVINDIHRHWLAYYSIKLITAVFSKSAMVKFDAPLSVLRAFTRKELEALLTAAGISNYTLRWKWAFRWQLIIRTQG
jgi:2-polyprenyl-3-methyl-5-hydroxy-6-metoxy-1,4-benzoquinol methylase